MSDKVMITKKGQNAEFFNILGKKVLRRDTTSLIHQEDDLEVKLGMSSKINCNFKLKKIKNRKLAAKKRGETQNKRKEEQHWEFKESDTFSKEKTFGNLENIYEEMPRAPHNTSQFLIENFRKERELQVPEVPCEELDYFNFLSQRTFKGIINPNSFLNLDDLIVEGLEQEANGEKNKDKNSVFSTEASTNDTEKETQVVNSLGSDLEDEDQFMIDEQKNEENLQLNLKNENSTGISFFPFTFLTNTTPEYPQYDYS